MVMNADTILDFLSEVNDPEIPALSILDLGVLRSVVSENGKWIVTITPTYSGCPAMRVIEEDIVEVLKEKGISNFEIRTQLTPAWTTDWLTSTGKIKLIESGIAPPATTTANKNVLLGIDVKVACPFCKSVDTHMISQFGSTACKALWKCQDCLEPFDYFKCL